MLGLNNNLQQLIKDAVMQYPEFNYSVGFLTGLGLAYDWAIISFISIPFCFGLACLLIRMVSDEGEESIFNRILFGTSLTILTCGLGMAFNLLVCSLAIIISQDYKEASIQKYEKTLLLVESNPDLEYLYTESKKDGKLSNWEAWRINQENERLKISKKQQQQKNEKKEVRNFFLQKDRSA
jgi:hypothetical protein